MRRFLDRNEPAISVDLNPAQDTDQDGIGDACGPAPTLRNSPYDYDVDGDVDQQDFATMQACYTARHVWLHYRSRIPNPLGLMAYGACDRQNVNGGCYVDANDLTLMLRCASGPSVPADPA